MTSPSKTPKAFISPNTFLPPKLRDLFFRKGKSGEAIYVPSRYKIAFGGRGSGKSWGLAGTASVLGTQGPLRVLCVREYQTSMRDSIHKLLGDQIQNLGLSSYYDVQGNGIFGRQRFAMDRRTEFIFAGIKTDPGKIKSTEGIDICLVEEAEKVSEVSWRTLVPTIFRVPGSEIWVCFNPRDETDATYERYVKRLPSNSRRVMINWNDNPWFPAGLNEERQSMLTQIHATTDDEERAQLQTDYDHVWEGHCYKNTNASVYRRRVVIEYFSEPPEGTRFYFGADWGFANDPTCLIRFFITVNEDRSEELWVSHEVFGYRVEIDEIPQLFDSVPGARQWPIKGDSARPETISFVAKLGFHLTAAEKWPGSLEDGIAHVKSFVKIHIHERCKKMQEEARKYSYKVDKITNDVLPIVVDAFNHGWDAIRYGLDGVIQRRGAAGLWSRLGK
jgi:phage terminase large subunit